MKKLKAFFSSKNRKNIFRLCIPALLITVLFSLVAFIPVCFGRRAGIENVNKHMIDAATSSLNDFFMDIDDVYRNIERSLENEVLYGEEGIVSDNRFEESQLSEVFSSNIMSKSYIEEIVVMKKTEEMLITSEGVLSKRDFFGKNYVNDVYSLSFFNNLTTDYLNVKIIPPASYKNLEKHPGEDPVSLLASVKRCEKNNNVNIIIFISKDKFIKQANLLPLDNNINFKVYDNNNSVVYSNTDSDYMISTTGLDADFDSKVINLGVKKYYIEKSGYNYFYYVAETRDVFLIILIIAFLLIALGVVLGVYLLMKGIFKLDKSIMPVFTELEMDLSECSIEDIAQRLSEYKDELSDNKDRLSVIDDEIKNSFFMKAATSSSFYSKYKKAMDNILNEVLPCEKFFILSIETVRENIKLPKYDQKAIKEFFDKNGIKNIFIEEKSKKYLYLVGCNANESTDITNRLSDVFSDIRNNNFEILVCFSREFENFVNLYEAFRDIRICRDYRGINDKISVLGTGDVAYGSHIYLPPNFKEELAGKIMAKEEGYTRKYIKDIFEKNIQNNIPLSKFELMLRQLLNAVIDILSMNRKSNSDMYELEQMFLSGIEQLKENHDVYGIMNNLINLVHLSINSYDTGKSVLNRTDVIKYINANFDKDLYLEKIASEFGTTPKYFSNYFKKEFTIGFSEYLTNLRISYAKKLLAETDKSLSDISVMSGYVNQATFAAAFKKVTGLPPGKYREVNKG